MRKLFTWQRAWNGPHAFLLRKLLWMQSEAHRAGEYTAAEAFEQEIKHVRGQLGLCKV